MVSGEKKLFSLVDSGFCKEAMEGKIRVCWGGGIDLISANVTNLVGRDKCKLGCTDLSVFGILAKEQQA